MAKRVLFVGSPTATLWGQQVAQLASNVIRSQHQAQRIVDAFNSMASGGAGPWEQLEAELGLQPGQGQAMYGIINDCRATLGTIEAISDIDQGNTF